MAGSSMRDIKRRIRSVKSIEQITNAMKLVSAAKLRLARNTFDKTHESLVYITDGIDQLCGSALEIPSRYLADSREIKRSCYIIITSNRGLAGSYNANVIKMAEKEMAGDAEKPLLVCIGGRGQRYFERHGQEILSEYLEPPEKMTFLDAKELAAPLIELYDKEEIDEIVIVHTMFVTTIDQYALAERLLPFAPRQDGGGGSVNKLPEYEPGPVEVFDYLVKKYAEIMVYRALVEAATCEHAARRMAMQNATDNAKEMTDNLELFYNRARQAAITSEITEIVSGADAIK
jgi:F-type H+-transporting ATPase subunit gamma